MRRLHFTWILVAVGVVARFAWALAAPAVVFDDAANYRALARSLAAGHGYASAAGPTAYWTPGWPAWMSLFYRLGAGDRGVAVASALLGALTVALAWALARAVASRETARVAAAACALAPSLVLLPSALLSENLALPLVALAALVLVRASRVRDFALFGLSVAAATWVRESCAAFVLAGVVLACASGAWRVRVARGAAVALAFAIALAPWVLRNREAMGRATLTTSAGVNLCIGLGEGATGGYRALDHAKEPLATGEAARSASGLRCAEDGLRAHPLELVTLAPAKLSRLLVWDDWIVDDFLSRAKGASRGALNMLRALCNLYYWALLALGVAGALRVRQLGRVLALFGASVALAVLVGFGGGRFHAPLLPLLAAGAACYRRTP